LQQLIDDCCLTLKYQVKTGTWRGVNWRVLPSFPTALKVIYLWNSISLL
jgi:hypothetical protein